MKRCPPARTGRPTAPLLFRSYAARLQRSPPTTCTRKHIIMPAAAVGATAMGRGGLPACAAYRASGWWSGGRGDGDMAASSLCHAGACAAARVASTTAPRTPLAGHVFLNETIRSVIHAQPLPLTLRALAGQKNRLCLRDTGRLCCHPATIGGVEEIILFADGNHSHASLTSDCAMAANILPHPPITVAAQAERPASRRARSSKAHWRAIDRLRRAFPQGRRAVTLLHRRRGRK